jgi:hypothetical protein
MKGGDDSTVEGKAGKVSVSQKMRQRMNRIIAHDKQFVVTHTVRQNEILALVDSWVTGAPSVKMLRPRKKKKLLLILVKKTCLVSVCSGSFKGFLSRETVCQRVMTDCCFMRDMSPIVIVFHPTC